MTKARQDFNRNAEKFAQKFCRRAAKILNIREKIHSFFSLWRGKIQTKQDKDQFIKREKAGYFEEISCQRSLERFHFLVYVIVVIKSSLQWVPHMQQACLYNNLEAQKWQNLNNIFIVTQKKMPNFFADERQKCLN